MYNYVLIVYRKISLPVVVTTGILKSIKGDSPITFVALQVYVLAALVTSIATNITLLVSCMGIPLLNHCHTVADGLARVSQLRRTVIASICVILICVTVLTGLSAN